MKDIKGKKVLVRSVEAGVYFGICEDVEGAKIELKGARNIWRWRGANSWMDIVTSGVDTSADYTRITTPADILITNCCAIAELSDEVFDKLNAAPVWS